MKNLLVYSHPDKKFDPETEVLVKVQIDNSLGLNWKPKDILLFTNFPYEYHGIRSHHINSTTHPHRQATKLILVAQLLKSKFFEKYTDEEIFWSHDFDAYQLEAFAKNEPSLENAQIGVSTYGWMRKWCLGSIFFKKSAAYIFQWTQKIMNDYQTDDERAFRHLLKNSKTTRGKVKELNITYNFGMRHVDINWANAVKPLKVVHFHPNYTGNVDTKGIFLKGQNPLGFPLVNQRFLIILSSHHII